MSSQETAQEMLAVVKTGPGSENVLLQRMPEPEPTAGQVRIRVLATGICGTDVHVAHDEYAHEAPVIMGHEILGVVESVGAGVETGLLGSRVACETYFSTCGLCDWCRAGRPNLCPNRRSIGSFENGGFARFLVLPAINLHRLPDSLEGIEGVLSEPLACVAQCLLDPPVVNPGDRVLVTGPGAMGQIAAQVARAQGGSVTVAGLERGRSASAPRPPRRRQRPTTSSSNAPEAHRGRPPPCTPRVVVPATCRSASSGAR